MKNTVLLTLACAAGMAVASSAVFAETTEERMQKAPTKTMGDEGKLPPTEQMSTKVPDMGSPEPGNESAGPSGPKGPPKRMGDEGKLPATNNMSGAVPRMAPDSK
jgi:hypothetical protein